MTAFERAQIVYLTEPCARSFNDDLGHHLVHGYVWSSPTCFVMFRPVQSTWPLDMLRAPWETDPAGDCWWVWLLAGDTREAISKMPFAMPRIGFERQNEPRVLDAHKFLAKLKFGSL